MRPAIIALALLVPPWLVACDDDVSVITSSIERRYRAAQEDARTPDTFEPDTSQPDTFEPADTATPDTDLPDDTVTPDDTVPPDTQAPDDTVAPDDTTIVADTDATSDTGPDDAALHPARYPAARVHSPITPSVVERLREIQSFDPALADDVFMKVGASSTVSAAYLKCFSGSAVDLGAHTHLQTALDYFLSGDAAGADPFSRTTLAAKVGMSAVWAIGGDPSPMEQEYLALEPRFAFVNYGTNDMGLGSTYESALWGFGTNLWTLVDELIGWGVIPILVNMARRLDSTAADAWVPTYNAVIRGIAQGRQVPHIDMNLAYEPLPDHGISGDGIHGTTYPSGACRLTAEGLRYGFNMRNLQSLAALDRVMVALLDGEPFDPAGPALSGRGTRADPIVIDGLPFSDMRSTRDAPSRELDVYSGCASDADESGPEVVYRLVLTAPTRLRATVHDRGETDIDLHLLDASASAAGCIERAHRIVEADLAPGTYHLVLDTFVSNGVEKSGEYLFTLLERP